MKSALAIIPTYNEADNIELIIRAVLQVATEVDHYSLDILIVDDNSPDGTGEIVKRLQKHHKNIHLITGAKKGLGKAYIRGFQYGLSHKQYDAFIMMDADLSHNPSYIPAMLRKVHQGKDYVIGSRYMHGGTIPGNWPLKRIINSRVANFVAKTFIDIDRRITDVTGGFKAISREGLERIKLDNIHASGYFFQVNLLHEFVANQLDIAEVPIAFVDRKHGLSKLKIRDVLEFIFRSYRLNPSSPLRQFMRFCVVGATGTLVNLLTLSILVHLTNLAIPLCDAIAIEISIVSNFIMNHYYTFRVNRSSDEPVRVVRKFLSFNLGMLGGAAISFASFSLLYKVLHMHYIIADVIAIIISMGWNYWVSKNYVWKVVDAGA